MEISFRAKPLEPTKPLPIYLAEELPDLQEYSAINRAVPQMPSGMEKEEECEHHLQRAIVTGLIIPTPEVEVMSDLESYERMYPANYKPSRQLIHMQPFSMEEDIPDYDIDSEDERWLSRQKLDITSLKFEEMMDKLEKNCALNMDSQNDKELLLKDNDEVSIAVYDYWLSKRYANRPLPLVPMVKTEANHRSQGGAINNNNPYLAFRRRTEKMQTRKNRKSDETSYEKMLKLRRDLSRALQLLEMVKRRESAKKELLELTVQMYEKRYQANDFSGALLADVSACNKAARPAFAPIYANQYTSNHTLWPIKPPKDDVGSSRKEKRQYKKRKHKTGSYGVGDRISVGGGGGSVVSGNVSSGDEEPSLPNITGASPPSSPHTAFPFLRNKNCSYHAPLKSTWSWPSQGEGTSGDKRFSFYKASISHPRPSYVGRVRRRIGRGGRVILDRGGTSDDDFWSSVDFTVFDNARPGQAQKDQRIPSPEVPHFQPRTPPRGRTESETDGDWSTDSSGYLQGGSTLCVQVNNLADSDSASVELDLTELFPDVELDTLRCELSGKRPSRRSSGTLEVDRGGSSEFLVVDDVSWSSSSSGDRNATAMSPRRQTPTQRLPVLHTETGTLSTLATTPSPSSSSPRTERILSGLPNGPVNHVQSGSSSSSGSWSQLSGSPLSSRWTGSSVSSTSPIPVASSSTNLLNSKLAARAGPPQVNTDPGGSGETVHRRQSGSAGQTSLVHSTAMEVT